MSRQSGRGKRPTGIVILAIIQMLAGIQLLASSLVYFVLVEWSRTPEGIAEIGKAGEWALKNARGVFFLLGVVYLALGIGSLLLARGYVKGSERARHKGRVVAVLAIIFAIVGGVILPARLDPGSPLWTVAFNLIVVLYLGSKKVRRYFSS
jgi:hypothetical protein